MTSAVIGREEVRAACQRLENFVMVASARPKSEFADAIANFAEAAGLSREAHGELRRRLERTVKDGELSWACIGVIIGLFLAGEAAQR